MKKHVFSEAYRYRDRELEKRIEKKHIEFKEMARKNGKHFAQFNTPLQTGDDLNSYTGEIRSNYEKLAADSLLHLQPAAHYPEARMNADYAMEKDKKINSEIIKKHQLNDNDRHDLGDYDPRDVGGRIHIVLILSLLIFLGDVLFNAKAFEITSENLIFALIISISISIGVFVSTHVIPLIYKNASTEYQKRLIIISTLVSATVLFLVLALLRSKWLAQQVITINPVYFVIINLFLFVVSSMLSYYFLPCYSEIKEHRALLKKHKNVIKRNKEIKIHEEEQDGLKLDTLASTVHHLRSNNYSAYIIREIQKMYVEAVGTFCSANLIYRPDRCAPDCFKQVIPELHIDYSTIPSGNLNPKS